MNDYFTFFYVKHFELPMCMKCAIQINLPCLALPCLAFTTESQPDGEIVFFMPVYFEEMPEIGAKDI